jgi:hypothetical protein
MIKRFLFILIVSIIINITDVRREHVREKAISEHSGTTSFTVVLAARPHCWLRTGVHARHADQ